MPVFFDQFLYHTCLVPLARGRLAPPQWGQSAVFWQGTMASNSKVWTPILSASHLAAHCPCACWRSQTDGAKAKNHVICKKKADIKFQGSQTSWQRLSLEIVSIMLQKGSRTRGNPGRVQHTLETCLNLCREYRHTSGLDSDRPCTP